MRWMTSAVLLANILYLVFASETDDGQPVLQIMARSSVYNVGEKKAIYCKGLNLNERIEWYTQSGEVVEGRSSKNTRVYVERPKNESLVSSLVPLIIHSTKIEDTGNWTCKSGPLSETIAINVGEKVNLSVKQENVEAEESKTARLVCIAKGRPKPKVHWYKDSVLINDDHKKYFLKEWDNNYQLEIRDLTHQDSGDYTCKVTQKALSHYAFKHVQLAVEHKPLLINGATNEIYTSKMKVEEVFAIVNETKNISCIAIAHPPPTYRWNRREGGYDLEPIEDEDTVITSEDRTVSVLVLRMYNESYAGEYKCSVNNSKGQISIVYHVLLGNKPEAPDFVSLVSANATELVFNVTCFACNMTDEIQMRPDDPHHLPVLGYSFAFVPVEEGFPADWEKAVEIEVDITSFNDTLFTVGPLNNNTVYHARVRTRNSAGYSEWVNITPNPATAHGIRTAVSIMLLILCYLFVNEYH